MTQLSPPPYVEKFKYKDCRQVNDIGGRVYITPDGHTVPSVTTILSATKDMTHLNEWKKRVGEENAKQISKSAAGVGTAMHGNLERFLAGLERQPGKNMVHVKANQMADVIIANGISKIDEFWAMEQSLYFPELYSGTTDLVGVFEGEPAIMDHKQTLKPKKEEWVEDYYIQLAAYATAHNEIYGTDIKRGVIFMCSQDLKYQQFDLTPENFTKWQDKWLDRVDTYYKSFS
jgi:genome maintenance exonuclease 1